MRQLRWLRTGVLVLILAAAGACLLVASQAHGDITAATDQGARAIAEVDAASASLTQANAVVNPNAPATSTNTAATLNPLTGPTATYTSELTAARQDLVVAAENNIDGSAGADDIQFAEGLLDGYGELIQQAAIDEANTPALAPVMDANANTWLTQGGVLDTLRKLRTDETHAVASHLGSWWLRPGAFWWLLLAPSCVAALVAGASGYVMWRGFRRPFSVRLTGAVLLTLALVVLIGSLNVHDGGHASLALARWEAATKHPAPLAADAGLAFSYPTLAMTVILLLGALAMAFTAYLPRLNEYRTWP